MSNVILQTAGVIEPLKNSKGVEPDLIDFSDRDDEFLTSDVKQQALSFAMITAVVGFVLSSWLFLGERVGPASKILDRRAAEGRVVTKQKRAGANGGESYGGFRAPTMRSRSREAPKERPAWKDLEVATELDEDKVREKTSSRRKKLATNIGRSPDYSRRKVVKRSRPQPRKLPTTKRSEKVDLDRLLFPVVGNRPARGSLSDVESKVSGNLISISNARGRYQVGLVLNSKGQAIISQTFARRDYMNRMWSKGSLRQGRVLAIDGEFGVALIQVSGGDFEDLPLAPSPPLPGERLLSFTSQTKGAQGRVLLGGMAFGRAGFFVDGDITGGSQGTPLLNNRGEVAGFHFETLPGAPGRGFHLACDTSVVQRLLRGYKGGGSRSGTKSDALRQLTSVLSRLESEGEARRGRALAGVGLSDFHLGMSTDDVKRWASDPDINTFGAGIERWDCPAPPVSLYFVNDRLAVAATRHNGFSTPEGLSPGAEANFRDLSRKISGLEQSPGLFVASGLEIVLDSSERVRELVVKPVLGQ